MAGVGTRHRVRSLDGLRAVAVVAVMIYHLKVPHLLSGGYIGVDVFFVISGYLITSLLVQESDEHAGLVNLQRFYARRALRLFPALGAAAAVALVLSPLADAPTAHETLTGIGWIAIYAGNWVRAFDPNALGTLGHTWSLAIEEQYYLVWPAVFVVLDRKGVARARLAQVLLGLAVLEMSYRELLVRDGASLARIFFGTDTHCAGLLVGCAVAYGLASQARRAPLAPRALAIATWGGAAALVALLLLANDGLRSSVATYPAVTVASAALLVGLVGGGAPLLGRLLGARPAVWVGRRSYGLYLWHYVVYVALPWHAAATTAVGELAMVAVSFAVAALSYRFVELPALRVKKRFRPGPPVQLGTVVGTGLQ